MEKNSKSAGTWKLLGRCEFLQARSSYSNEKCASCPIASVCRCPVTGGECSTTKFFTCRLSATSSSEEVKETAAVMAIGLDNVFQSARSVAVKSSTSTNPHLSLVELPVFSLVEEPERSEHDIVDEEEEFLSPEERVARRKEKAAQKAAAHYKVTNQVSYESISNLHSGFVCMNQAHCVCLTTPTQITFFGSVS